MIVCLLQFFVFHSLLRNDFIASITLTGTVSVFILLPSLPIVVGYSLSHHFCTFRFILDSIFITNIGVQFYFASGS